MPDLYAINLHLQERLEQEWREEVRAVEAAVWLGDAGLLRNYKKGSLNSPRNRSGAHSTIAKRHQSPSQVISAHRRGSPVHGLVRGAIREMTSSRGPLDARARDPALSVQRKMVAVLRDEHMSE